MVPNPYPQAHESKHRPISLTPASARKGCFHCPLHSRNHQGSARRPPPPGSPEPEALISPAFQGESVPEHYLPPTSARGFNLAQRSSLGHNFREHKNKNFTIFEAVHPTSDRSKSRPQKVGAGPGSNSKSGAGHILTLKWSFPTSHCLHAGHVTLT